MTGVQLPPPHPMPPNRRWLRWPNVLAALAILFIMLMAGAFLCPLLPFEESSVSTSPDGAYRIILRDRRSIDRNFSVSLVNQSTGVEREIFDSYDQSPLIRGERFVWSDDSSKFALIGDRYFVVPGAGLPNGEIVFLVYDIDAGRLWCNTDHVGRGLTPITAAQAANVIGKPLQ